MESAAERPGPLARIRVLDLTNVLAGPFCCHQLAHLGADVIKVEAPGAGDLARQLGADPELNRRLMGVSFLAQNAGKRSITLDLKRPEGKTAFRRLVRTAAVVVENFRPGVMARLGLDFESLTQENPRLVYCAISGFGQDGPLSGLPAYDQVIQGMSGVMSITGSAETAPYRVGFPISDTIGGLTAAMAVAAALADTRRDGGCFIDVSMLEATLATMGWAVSNHLIAGQTARPMGNENATASPSGTFRTADGLLNIAANKQEQFEALCRVVGCESAIADERFGDRHSRLRHRAELTVLLESRLAAASAAHWWPRLTAAGVPAGPVASVAEALALPQIRDRGLLARFDEVPGVDRPVTVVRTGVKLNGRPPSVSTPPPELGRDTVDVLREIGYSELEIQALRESGTL